MARWALSPDTVIGWRGDRLRIGKRASPNSWVAGNGAATAALLDRFRPAADPEDVLRDLDEPAARQARILIRELAAIDVLVPDSDSSSTVVASGEASLMSLAELEARRESLPFLEYDDLGLTVTNCGSQELSPGCQACKAGAWLCVFVGLKCNAHCPFCPQPAAARTVDEGSYGTGWVDHLLEALQAAGTRVKGVSASGGEPFLYEDVVRRIVGFVHRNLPHAYQWMYTNGLLANGDSLRRFRDFGLDEIRFNLAASEFGEQVLGLIRDHAVPTFSWVSVEVPVYEATFHHLVEREVLLALDDMGVRQLNLGQLFSGAASSPVMHHLADRFRVGDSGSPMTATMVQYRHWTYDIFEYADRKGLGIRINDCSEDAKQAQRLARRNLGGSTMLALMDWAYPRPSPPPDLRQPPAEATHTASGLAFTTLAQGRGARHPGDGDFVQLRFVGWTPDGAVVDSSFRAGLDGMAYRMGSLIPGLEEALRTMVVGDRRRLWVPPALTGDARTPIVFDLELADVRPTVPPC